MAIPANGPRKPIQRPHWCRFELPRTSPHRVPVRFRPLVLPTRTLLGDAVNVTTADRREVCVLPGTRYLGVGDASHKVNAYRRRRCLPHGATILQRAARGGFLFRNCQSFAQAAWRFRREFQLSLRRCGAKFSEYCKPALRTCFEIPRPSGERLGEGRSGRVFEPSPSPSL